MKAVQISSYGGIDVLEIAGNVPKPTVSKEQVLVEVYASSPLCKIWRMRV